MAPSPDAYGGGGRRPPCCPGPGVIGRHVGRLGRQPFVLRLGPPDASGVEPVTLERYWEIEYQGRAYPWRPVRAEDELDLPRLMRGAMAYLGDLQGHC
jgi:hypothetical protein